MKKTMLLSLALGLASAASLTAATIDVYLTGSTAFRASVYNASTKLFSSAPTIYYGDAAHGGAASGFNSSTASWVMFGTPVSTLTGLTGNTLVIHGLFTGSIQGIQTVEQSVKLAFPTTGGGALNGGNAVNYVTNTPTIGFSDASASATPYPVAGNYAEEAVAVQPFVFCKSRATGDVSNYVNNISWEQLAYGIPQGRIPVSAWSNKDGDDRTNKFVYLLQRTLDSGTRRVETAEQYYGYGDTVGVYIYDFTNQNFYLPSSLTASAIGNAPYGVIGPAGLGNANQNWGYVYVGGGNIATALNYASPSNQSIGCLSFADARTVGPQVGSGTSFTNWANVVSLNGLWPTAEGAGIHAHVFNTTNDFSPVTTGYYTSWGEEVLVHIVNPAANPPGDQNITQTQLGNNTTAGSFLGVFNAQTKINGGSPLVGSIENEILLTQPLGATAIRLSDMKSNRGSVGGAIAPF